MLKFYSLQFRAKRTFFMACWNGGLTFSQAEKQQKQTNKKKKKIFISFLKKGENFLNIFYNYYRNIFFLFTKKEGNMFVYIWYTFEHILHIFR